MLLGLFLETCTTGFIAIAANFTLGLLEIVHALLLVLILIKCNKCNVFCALCCISVNIISSRDLSRLFKANCVCLEAVVR